MIPALDGLIQGRDIADAIEMARDYIGTFSLADKLPPPDPTLPSVKADSLATLVTVNISAYRRRYDKESSKRRSRSPIISTN